MKEAFYHVDPHIFYPVGSPWLPDKAASQTGKMWVCYGEEDTTAKRILTHTVGGRLDVIR